MKTNFFYLLAALSISLGFAQEAFGQQGGTGCSYVGVSMSANNTILTIGQQVSFDITVTNYTVFSGTGTLEVALPASQGLQYVGCTTFTPTDPSTPVVNNVLTLTRSMNGGTTPATVSGTVTFLVTDIVRGNLFCQLDAHLFGVTDWHSYCTSNDIAVCSMPIIPGFQIHHPNGAFCSGDAQIVEITLSLHAQGSYQYLWSNADNDYFTFVEPTVPTTYTVTVSNTNACVATNSVFVNVLPRPAGHITCNLPTPICDGNPITLSCWYSWLN